jgi:hypothetical protein
MVTKLCSIAYSETMIHEISVFDRCSIIQIDTDNGQISEEYYDYRENTVELRSEEGMQILDRWYGKWTSVIRNLKKQTDNIQVDLSGGFDTRMVFTLFLGSGIDLNEVFVNSKEDDLYTHCKDFEIATAISKHYGFELNKRKAAEEITNFTMDDILNISFYLKLGFHKQMYWKVNRRTPYRYVFGGNGGGCVRGYWDISEEEFIEEQVKACEEYPEISGKLAESVRKITQSAFHQLKEKERRFGREMDPGDVTHNLYRDTRCRNHFGKELVENYYGGLVKLSPLLDQDLHKLRLSAKDCKEKDLLMAVIFERYCRELLSFEFQGQRTIPEEALEYARTINAEYPFRGNSDGSEANEMRGKETVQTTVGKDPAFRENKNLKITGDQVTALLKDTFYSKKLKDVFTSLYGEDAYDRMAFDMEKRRYYPLKCAYIAMAVAKVADDVMASENMRHITAADYIKAQTSYVLPVSERPMPPAEQPENVDLVRKLWRKMPESARIRIKKIAGK